MEALNEILKNTFFWIFWAALFGGAAFAGMFASTKKAENVEQARGRKWSFVSIALSLAAISATLSVFIPRAENIFDPRLLYFSGGVFLLSFISFKLKKSIGFFTLTIVFTLFLLFQVLFIGWTGFKEQYMVAEITPISSIENRTQYIIKEDSDPQYLRITGNRLYAHFAYIKMADYYFFLPYRNYFQFRGFSPDSNQTFPGEEEKNRIDIDSFLLSLLQYLPGVEYKSQVSASFVPQRLQEYRLTIEENSTVSIKEWFQF